uniref:Uncharacterized protein n=1 Tax=Chenopodium quinoa TaxID=63459 RepID=A0A803N997_CHEQI
MAPLVFDATNAWNNSTTYEVHSDGGNAMEFGSSSGNDETPNWRYVIKANPRNFFDFPNDEDTHESESLWDHVAPPVTNYENENDEDINIVRDDVENEVALDDDLEDNDDDSDSSSE